jgi:hypothetical protein
MEQFHPDPASSLANYTYTTYQLLYLYSDYPVGARFSTPVQTGPGAHPDFYTMGTGSFPGVKRTGRGVDHPPHLAQRLKKE